MEPGELIQQKLYEEHLSYPVPSGRQRKSFQPDSQHPD